MTLSVEEARALLAKNIARSLSLMTVEQLAEQLMAGSFHSERFDVGAMDVETLVYYLELRGAAKGMAKKVYVHMHGQDEHPCGLIWTEKH